MKVAVVTGITGQDGSYLAELLIEKGYKVFGLMRRCSNFNTQRIEHIFSNPQLQLCYGDLLDITSIMEILQKAQESSIDDSPIEIYNMAAQSHVKVSFELPLYTAETDALGTLHLLEGIRKMGDKFVKKVKLCHASTSEMFGATPPPQCETTPFHPRSPYGVSKLFAFWAVKNYREAYNMFACNAISFNHESERRGETFVTRKIAKAVGKYANNRNKDFNKPVVELGNLNAERDWGHAADYVRAMWMMLQQDIPDDYVIATGESHSVREFIEKAFKCIGIDVVWEGEGLHEVGKDVATGEILVSINPKFFRPAEVDRLLGNPKKLMDTLGWKPDVTFDELVKRMVLHDMNV